MALVLHRLHYHRILHKMSHSMTKFPFQQQLLQLAKREPYLERIWLFGSQARGDAAKLSDYDLAFDWHPQHRDEWIRFKFQLEDELKTLHTLDLIYMPEAGKTLKQEIEQTGKLIYEKK